MADEQQQQQTEQAQDAQTGETPEGGQDKTPVTFGDWYKTLGAEQQELIDGYTNSLKSAIKTERDAKTGYEKKIRDLVKQAESGSELRNELEKMANDVQVANAKAAFFDAAHAANVRNLRLAWLAAADAGLVDAKTGECDFAKLKNVAPELFAVKLQPTANAGSGAGQNGAAQPSMNDWLRASAGRR